MDESPLESCPFCGESVWLDIVGGEVDWRPCCEAMQQEVEQYGFENVYGMNLRDALIQEVGAHPEEVREVFGRGLHDPDDPFDSDYYSDTTHIRYPLEEQVPMQLVQGKRGRPAFTGPQGWQQSVFESVEKNHSHHKAPQGWKFGVAVNNGPRRVGVAVVSNPVSRLLMQQEPDTLEVTRVCVWGHPKLRRNAVSKLYSLCAREAKKLGASKLITYTLESESAGSLVASGWTPVALSEGGAWDRPGRKREGRGKVAEYTSPKVRWEKVLDPRRARALPRIELPKKAERHLDDAPPQATPAEIAEMKDAPVEAEAFSSEASPRQNNRRNPSIAEQRRAAHLAKRPPAGSRNPHRRQNPSEVGVNWLEPDNWPEKMSHKQFAHDFRVLLQDHDFDSPSYDIMHIRLKDVVIPPLDDEDDRHFDSETGEPSTAYIDGLVEAMRAGVPMPPIVVGNVEEGSEKPWGWPYDGRHRLNAAHRLGLKWVPAIDVTGRGDV